MGEELAASGKLQAARHADVRRHLPPLGYTLIVLFFAHLLEVGDLS